jgi:hypothetical protein
MKYRLDTYMSKGYTIALARTAPVAPAIASPQGGIGVSLDGPTIARRQQRCSL